MTRNNQKGHPLRMPFNVLGIGSNETSLRWLVSRMVRYVVLTMVDDFQSWQLQPLGLLVCQPIIGVGSPVITGCFVCVSFSQQRICLARICTTDIGDGLHDNAADQLEVAALNARRQV